jgi:hypothetical protein
MDEFQLLSILINGEVKPIVLRLTDGGPDQNPRFKKVISSAIRQFKLHNLDVLIVITNAPGRSAFNPVERRMAALSKQLSGVILPHDHFGTHLDSQHRTINTELELLNFAKAGEELCHYWKEVATKAEYVHPEESEIEEPEEISEDWKSNHVLFTKYNLQIVKCDNLKCCRKPRSSWFTVNPSRFLPAPIRIVQSENGIQLCKSSNEGHFLNAFAGESLAKKLFNEKFSFDYFCPSVTVHHQCKQCLKFFATKELLKCHNRMHIQEKKKRKSEVSVRRVSKRVKKIIIDEIPEENSSDESDLEFHAEENLAFNNNSPLPVFSLKTCEALIEQFDE